MSEMARPIAAGWMAAFDPRDLTRPSDLYYPTSSSLRHTLHLSV